MGTFNHGLLLLFQLVTLIQSIEGAMSTETNDLLFTGSWNELYSDDGELAEVSHLTKQGGEYHIIKIKIPSLGLIFTVHLVKSDTASSQLSVHHGGEIETEVHLQNCLYFGRVVDFPGGMSSLSNCGDHQGFYGHIILGNDHFVIEPISTFATNTEGAGNVIFHKVFRPHEILQRHNASIIDVLQVPPDDLKKALANMKPNKVMKTEDETETSEDLDPVTILNVDDDSEEVNSISETLAAKAKKKTNSKTKKSKKQTAKKVVRKAEYIVDIAVFTDVSFMENWQKRLPKNTKAKLKLYILNIVNDMNLLYRQKSIGIDIGYRLVHIEMLSTIPSEMESSNWGGQASSYLGTFCKYAANKNTNGEKWDHALLLTGFDLAESGDPSLIGMAWYGKMCIPEYSCSVSEGKNFESTIIITHEMGHSLGIWHDGEQNNADCDADTNIMSPSTGPGKIQWSACSARNIKSFVETGDGNAVFSNPGEIPSPSCLQKPSTLRAKTIKYSKNKLPGEIYPAKIQCQYHCGKNCVYAEDTANLCSMMICLDPTEYQIAHPALEGTECASGKYCRAGECVEKTGSTW